MQRGVLQTALLGIRVIGAGALRLSHGFLALNGLLLRNRQIRLQLDFRAMLWLLLRLTLFLWGTHHHRCLRGLVAAAGRLLPRRKVNLSGFKQRLRGLLVELLLDLLLADERSGLRLPCVPVATRLLVGLPGRNELPLRRHVPLVVLRGQEALRIVLRVLLRGQHLLPRVRGLISGQLCGRYELLWVNGLPDLIRRRRVVLNVLGLLHVCRVSGRLLGFRLHLPLARVRGLVAWIDRLSLLRFLHFGGLLHLHRGLLCCLLVCCRSDQVLPSQDLLLGQAGVAGPVGGWEPG